MSELTYERISSHFHLPINEASKELSVCATILKKVCRSLGIKRWPHRKIRSLDNMIFQLTEKLEETNNPQEIARIKSEIANFEKTKEYIIRNPNISYKSVVPKSTLQSFSKSKTKGSQNNRFVVTPNSEELVLEVLTSLATQNGSSSSCSSGFHATTHSYHTLHNLNSLGCNNTNNNILMMNSSSSNNDDDNDVNNHDVNNNTDDDDDDALQSPDSQYQSAELKENMHELSPNSPPKPPLKKLILQRKKEESTTSQPPFFPDPLGHHSHVLMMMNTGNHLMAQDNKAGGDDDLFSTSPTVNNISSVNNTTTPTSTTPTQQDTAPISNNSNNNSNIQIIPLTGNTSPQSSKKRKWDDSEYEVSLEEFRKYKSTFPDIKYQRIYEDSPLVYISKGI